MRSGSLVAAVLALTLALCFAAGVVSTGVVSGLAERLNDVMQAGMEVW